MPRIPGLLLLSLVAVQQAAADDTVDLHAFSEPVHRGASLADGRPGAGITASWDFDSGWFVGGGAHYAGGTPSGQNLSQGVNANVGWFGSFANNRALELSLSRNEFIDVDDWSYTEVRADLHFGPDFSLMLAWSPDYYGRAETSNVAATWRRSLGERFYTVLAGGFGYVGDGVSERIAWGSVGVGLSVNRYDVSLSYNAVDSNTETIFQRPRDTLALAVSYRLR